MGGNMTMTCLSGRGHGIKINCIFMTVMLRNISFENGQANLAQDEIESSFQYITCDKT